MTRRIFLSIFAACAAALASLWLALRSRRDPVADVAGVERERGPVSTGTPARNAEAVAEFVRGRIVAQMPAVQGVAFDPITIITVVGLVIQLFQVCGWYSIVRQQRAMQRHPTGRVATSTKRRLMERFVIEHPEADSETSAAAVSAAVHAFASADREELSRLHTDLRRLKDSPTPIDLFEFTESLSELSE